MSVLKKFRRDVGYTHVWNDALERIPSVRARGLLLTMLSKPDDYDFDAGRLAAEVTEGRAAIQTDLKVLRAAGYYRAHRRQNEQGRWVTDTWVSDSYQPEWAAEYQAELDVPAGRTEGRLPNVGSPTAGERTSKPLLRTTTENQTTSAEAAPSEGSANAAPTAVGGTRLTPCCRLRAAIDAPPEPWKVQQARYRLRHDDDDEHAGEFYATLGVDPGDLTHHDQQAVDEMLRRGRSLKAVANYVHRQLCAVTPRAVA